MSHGNALSHCDRNRATVRDGHEAELRCRTQEAFGGGAREALGRGCYGSDRSGCEGRRGGALATIGDGDQAALGWQRLVLWHLRTGGHGGWWSSAHRGIRMGERCGTGASGCWVGLQDGEGSFVIELLFLILKH
jgi:hypothetical protein